MPKFPLNLPALLGKGAGALEREAAEAAAREAGAREAEILGREALPSTELRPSKLGDEAIDATFSQVDDAAKLAPEVDAAVTGGSNALRNTAVLGGAGLIGAGLYDIATRKPEITPSEMTPKSPAGMTPQEIPEPTPTPEPQSDPYSNLMKRIKDDSGLRGRLEKLAFGDIKRPEIKQMEAPKEVSLDVGGETFGGAEDLKRAQSTQNLLSSFANANDSISKGLSQAFRTQVGNSGDGLRADAKILDEQFKQKQSNQDKDPTSAASQMMRQQARNLGLANVSDNLTAEQIGKVLPQLKAQADRAYEIQKFNVDSQNKMGEKQYEVDSRRADRGISGLALLDRQAKSQADAQDKAQAKAKEAKSEGQKSLDREFAKEYNKWSSGEGASARNQIQALKDVSDSLAAGEVSTGSTSGLMPDALTSKSLLKARSDVQSAIMSSLRAVLGAQFTEKEGQKVIKNTWNEQDSPQNNMRRINRLIDNLNAQADAKDNKSMYFEQNGTLQGLKPVGKAEEFSTKDLIHKSDKASNLFIPSKTVVKTQVNPKTMETKIIYSDGSEEISKKPVAGVDYSRYNK